MIIADLWEGTSSNFCFTSVLSRVKVALNDTVIRLEHLPMQAETGVALEIRIKRYGLIQWNLCNPTPEFSDILWHSGKIYGPKVFLWTKIKPEYFDILYNPTNFPGPLVCWIRQVPLYKQKCFKNGKTYLYFSTPCEVCHHVAFIVIFIHLLFPWNACIKKSQFFMSQMFIGWSQFQ